MPKIATQERLPVRAFHPRTMGVIHPGILIKQIPGKEGGPGSALMDFSPLTFRGKSRFQVPMGQVFLRPETSLDLIREDSCTACGTVGGFAEYHTGYCSPAYTVRDLRQDMEARTLEFMAASGSALSLCEWNPPGAALEPCQEGLPEGHDHIPYLSWEIGFASPLALFLALQEFFPGKVAATC